MSDHQTPGTPPMPLLRRLTRWLDTGKGSGHARSNGIDSARMDLGYEAAYTPRQTDRSAAQSPSGEDRSPT
jgi:hypothetical protein